MASKSSRKTALFLALALLTGFGAQLLWTRGERALLQGALLWGVAIAAYVWAVWRPDPASCFWGDLMARFWDLLGGSWPRLALLVGALIGSALIGGAALRRPPDAARWDLLVSWVLVILLAIVGVLDWRALPDQLSRLWQSLTHPTPELVAVLVLTAVAALLRFSSLETIPFVLSGDEASMGLEAVGVLEGRLANPFATGWLSHPTLYFFFQAPFVRLLGRTVTSLRVSSALVATATVPLLYLYARRLLGRRVALLAATFLVGYHLAIHYGRLGMNNAWDPALALATLYGTDRGIKERSVGWSLCAGLCMGFGAYFYMGARMVPILVTVYVLLVWATRERSGTDLLLPLVFVVLGAVVASLPLLMFWRAHPADMVARWNMLAVGPSGWLAEEAARRGVSEAVVFLEQLRKAALGWVLYTDPTFHYRATIPLLGPGSAVFFVFGIMVSARRWRETGVALTLIWVALVTVLGGALLENPPSSPRYVLAIPAAATLVALGVDDLCQRMGAVGRLPEGASWALALLVAAVLSGASARYYLGTYTPMGLYGGPNTHVAHSTARYLQTLPASTTCYMLGAPRIFYGFATIPYLNPDVQGIDVLESLQSPTGVPPLDGNTVFIVLPERMQELEAVQGRYPEGDLHRHLDLAGRLLFASYVVKAG